MTANYGHWVRLKKYCELTGESENTLKKKRSQGQIIDGYHAKLAADGALWVNVERMSEWVEKSSYRR